MCGLQECIAQLEYQNNTLTAAHAALMESERSSHATVMAQALDSQQQCSAAVDEIMQQLASLRAAQETGLPVLLMAEFAKLKVCEWTSEVCVIQIKPPH